MKHSKPIDSTELRDQSHVDPDKVLLDNLADGIEEVLEEMQWEGRALPPPPRNNPVLDRLRAEDAKQAKLR